ncbi:MAG: selenocysteine-specific translation elongation factor [Chloroflexi bacterium]|nr:selenocysteine-specific translation elongation factor [Chloroflexota bacterium]
MYVIGTAGHVDHGKSTLVRALTGIDPDRLREEKERGLTIDLGFAWLTLPSGRDVSIVDVPGHERFIKNMLAGAGGVDLALLVVAADEGVMPQTREHLAILDLLDVPAGIVVLTKSDLVERDYADLVEADLAETLAGTRFAGAPAVRVSGTTGEGLPELLAAIDARLESTPPKRDLGRPRLPIDRAFTMQGFGVVVTGTLVDGALEAGQEVELQPGRLRARVRGLQRHKTKVARLEPGTRAAVNLSGIHAEDVTRGMVLSLSGAITPAHAIDVRLQATSILGHPLAHDAGITFLSATSESEGRLRLLDRDALLPGERAWAQLVLDSPVAVSRGDHCVVRTSNETAAGGVIVAINPRRHRRNHLPTIEALELQLAGAPTDRLLDLLLRAPLDAYSPAELLSIEVAAAEAAVTELLAAGAAVREGPRLFARAWLDAAAGRVAAAADEYLAANPLRTAAPREHVRSAARIDAAVFDAVVAHGVAGGRIDARPAGIAPPGYTVALGERQQVEADTFLAALAAGGASPPTEHLPSPALLSYLAEQGRIEDTGAGVVFDAATFAAMRRTVVAHIEANGSISLAEVRDLFGTSRKYAQALLEHLDALKVTRRVGDARVLRAGSEATR